MTESELITLFLELDSTIISMLTWYASITTALYTVAYMVGTKLHIRSVIFIILVFVVILGFLFFPVLTYVEFELDVIESLSRLKSNGVQLSPLSENLISKMEAGINPFALVSAFLVLIFPIGGIGYLIHQYRIGSISTGLENE